AAPLRRLLRADRGCYPCLVVRGRGGAGGAAPCGRWGVLPAGGGPGPAGGGGAGAPGPGGAPRPTGAGGGGGGPEHAPAGGGAEDEPETSGGRVVERTVTALRNQPDTRRYDAYRRQGLPITSSLMAAVVTQLNRRVPGTEAFWSADGAEALRPLRADPLRDD